MSHLALKLPSTAFLFKGEIDKKMERIERRGRRRKQLLDDVNEQRIYRNLGKEARDRTLWRTIFRKASGPIAGHIT